MSMDNNIEIWKDVIGYSIVIFINNSGKIKYLRKGVEKFAVTKQNRAYIIIEGKLVTFNSILLMRQLFSNDEIINLQAKDIKDLDGEIWKDIIGYEGLYQISSLGRVKSVHRNILLKPSKNNKGYYNLSLSKDKNLTYFGVNRLVATAFVENPLGRGVVNHINSIPTDNSASNLEWVSQSENVCHGKSLAQKTSKYSGVSFDAIQKKWQVSITALGKRYRFTGFKTEIDAYNKVLQVIEDCGETNKYLNKYA